MRGAGRGRIVGDHHGIRIAAQPPRGRPRDLHAAGEMQARLRQLDVPARAQDVGGERERRDRDGAQDLDRDPPDEPPVALQRRAEQRGGRAGVLRPGVPRAAGQLGGVQDLAVAPVEGVHGGGV